MKILSLVATLFCLVQQAMANLAYPGPIFMEQANGSRIALHLRGDEHYSFFTDEEGYTCIRTTKETGSMHFKAQRAISFF
jgi:hypothetical protein